MYVDIPTTPISIAMPGCLPGSIGIWKVMGRKYTFEQWSDIQCYRSS